MSSEITQGIFNPPSATPPSSPPPQIVYPLPPSPSASQSSLAGRVAPCSPESAPSIPSATTPTSVSAPLSERRASRRGRLSLEIGHPPETEYRYESSKQKISLEDNLRRLRSLKEETVGPLIRYLSDATFLEVIETDDLSTVWKVELKGKIVELRLFYTKKESVKLDNFDPDISHSRLYSKILYFSPETGEISSKKSLGCERVGTFSLPYLTAERTLAQQDGIAEATKQPLANYFKEAKVFECIGRGFSAAVYKTEDRDELHAWKLVTSETPEVKFATRYRKNGGEQLALGLKHPNIISPTKIVYYRDATGELTENPQEGDHIVSVHSPFFEGHSIITKEAEELPFEEETVVRIGLSIAEGLKYLKNQGILHRDVKPANILINKLGRVKLLDFGIATRPSEGELITDNRNDSLYASPEQISCKGYSYPADAWSLGVILFQMATGKLPYEQIWELREGNPNPRYAPATLSPKLKAVIDGLLTIDPTQRMKVEEANERLFNLNHSYGYFEGF